MRSFASVRSLVSPDGRCVAVRLGDPEALSHPALFSTETDQTRLLAPDEQSRREWLMLLANAAERLLKGPLSPVVVQGQTFERPTILPLPGELTSTGNVASRLGKIAELAQTVLPGACKSRPSDPQATPTRVCFSIIFAADFRAAADELELLDRETTDLGQRGSLLYLRALLRWRKEI